MVLNVLFAALTLGSWFTLRFGGLCIMSVMFCLYVCMPAFVSFSVVLCMCVHSGLATRRFPVQMIVPYVSKEIQNLETHWPLHAA